VQAAAACVTENVWPAIVIVPVRALVFGFDDALNVTVPLPLPLAPPVTVSQDVLLLTAVHAHPVAAVTPTLPVAAPAPTDCPVELSDGAHAPWK
jgi:hypothetical protein